MPAAHDIYAEQLSECCRGYPLYYPEPAENDRPIEIGDVGFLNQGAFVRLFSVTRSADDPTQLLGVPDSFERLELGHTQTYNAALEPGPLHSRSVSTVEANIGTACPALPMDASFNFKCTSKRGAILVQETQMKRETVIQSQIYEDYLRRHCQSWHEFAREKNIPLQFGQIMLILECSKTGAWSSAVYSHSSQEFSISFSLGNAFVPSAGVSAGVERIGPLQRRRSVQRPAPAFDPQPPMNHTVFFKAAHLGTRQSYYQSLISFFIQSRNKKSTSLHNSLSGASMGIRSSGPESRESSPDGLLAPMLNSTNILANWDLPDFHPVAPLLALAIENTDEDCVIVLDEKWCSPTGEISELIKEYAQFHFEMADSHVRDLVVSAGSQAYESTSTSRIITEDYRINSPDFTAERYLFQENPSMIPKAWADFPFNFYGTSSTTGTPNRFDNRPLATTESSPLEAFPGINAMEKWHPQRYDEMERLYKSSRPDCNNAYRNSDDFITHYMMQKHSPNRRLSKSRDSGAVSVAVSGAVSPVELTAVRGTVSLKYPEINDEKWAQQTDKTSPTNSSTTKETRLARSRHVKWQCRSGSGRK